MRASGRPRITRYGRQGRDGDAIRPRRIRTFRHQGPTPALRPRLPDTRQVTHGGWCVGCGRAAGRWPPSRSIRGGAVSDDQHYDVIVIGTGAGGGTFAHRLAPSGKRVLLLERGDYLPRERDNWDSTAVFVKGKYRAPEFWLDRARRRVPAGGQLLRRRQHQVLRRGAVPAAPAGLRRAPPPRRDLPGVADRVRRSGAVLHPGRAPLRRARPARRGPDRRVTPAPTTATRRCSTNRGSSSSATTSRSRACTRSTSRSACG